MLLSMVCTFSVASAAEPMRLRVELDKDSASRGETVKAAIYVDNYVPCSGMGVQFSLNEAFNADRSKITLETDRFILGPLNLSSGSFFVYSADASVNNVQMAEASFKLATMELQLNYRFAAGVNGVLTVGFDSRNDHMAWTDESKVPATPGAALPNDAVLALDPNLYNPNTTDYTVHVNQQKMTLDITAAPTTADRGESVVLDVNLMNAVPFAGMDVYIPVDDNVFALESVTGATSAITMANIVEKEGRKVIHLMVSTGANMPGVTDLATVTLKVKDTAPFGETKLENAIIAKAGAYILSNQSKELIAGTDYENPANLITVQIACKHSKGFTYVKKGNGTHLKNCNVSGCPFSGIKEGCTAVSTTETPATCTTAGYYTHTCICGYQWQEPNDQAAPGHVLTYTHHSGTSTDSKHTAVCSRCGYTVTEPCSFKDAVVSTPTCVKEGRATAACTGCGFSFPKILLKTPHTKTKIRFYCPTDTAAGKWSYYCDSCKNWPKENDEPIPAGNPYRDVTNPKSWFYKGVQYTKIIGVMTGTGNNGNPNNDISRAEVATILVRYLGYKDQLDAKVLSDKDFETYLNDLYKKNGIVKKDLKDLKPGTWYYRASGIACALGIFKGTNDGKFNPTNNITRQELCLVLHRLYKDAGLRVDSAKTYADIAKVPAWSKEAVVWAGSVGLFGGDEKHNFNPTQKATRAQVAVLMMRIDASLRNIEIM